MNSTRGVVPGHVSQTAPEIAETVAWLKSECAVDDAGAEQMIAYTNFFVADTAYPGVTTTVVPAAEVSFTR